MELFVAATGSTRECYRGLVQSCRARINENAKRLRELRATQVDQEKRRSARRESQDRQNETVNLEKEPAQAIKVAQESQMDTTALTRVSILRRKLIEKLQSTSEH